MKHAKPENIKTEMSLIGSIWAVFRDAVDGHLNSELSFSDIVEVTHKLESVVESCRYPLIKKYAEEMCKAVIQYLSTEKMGSNHDDEVRVFNEMANLLRLGYWVGYEGDEAEEDWEEIMNRARSIAHSFQAEVPAPAAEGGETVTVSKQVTGLANSMLLALITYLNNMSELRFNKAMERQEKESAAMVS